MIKGLQSGWFFSPRVSIDLTFHPLRASCETIDSDREAIEVYGGSDSRYGTRAMQDEILSLYRQFAGDC